MEKTKWRRANDLDGARSTLMEALKANPDSENLVKVWMKFAVLKRNLVNSEETYSLVTQALENDVVFITLESDELWLESIALERQTVNYSMKHCEKNAYAICSVGQFLLQVSRIDKAKRWLGKAVEHNPS
ncbi:hypothetical protein H4219_000519 [Mycoemilia scoparia]|uniref:Uncharacterized protein n=1 Tax=Mycoemilia scoparia TaxID=417184 RepID=A0A9W8AAU7_9FUNG|nr:hypothetical protein H4219_000519 [Mycoemilia scoparia]